MTSSALSCHEMEVRVGFFFSLLHSHTREVEGLPEDIFLDIVDLFPHSLYNSKTERKRTLKQEKTFLLQGKHSSKTVKEEYFA